jgi:hypothetical protein
MMREHLRIRDLADRRDGTLGAAAAAEADLHLAAGCPECNEAAARVDALLSVMSDGPLAPPPRALVRDVVRMFKARKWARLLEAPGRLVAKLLLDQRLELVPALRSAAGATRRTLWSVGHHEVDACLVERPADADLLGQILPADDDGTADVEGDVVAFRQGRRVAESRLDRDGRFEFLGLAHGTYALVGRVNGAEFTLAPLGIGEDA